MWDDKLVCFVERMEYNFDTKEGKLWMQEGNCCNMPYCIKMFTVLDPHVRIIITYAGGLLDTGYRLGQDGWIAMDLRQVA